MAELEVMKQGAILISAAEGSSEVVLEIALNLAKENVSELDEYLKRGVYGK